MSKGKLYVFAAFGIAIIAAIYFFQSPGKGSTAVSTGTTSAPANSTDEPNEGSKPPVTTAAQADAVLQNISDAEKELYAKFKRGLEEHGYSDTGGVYSNLSDQDLLALVEAGDVSAIQHRASKLKLNSPDDAKELFLTAAAYGSSAALIQVAATNMLQLRYPESAMRSPENYGPAVVETYAYVLAASAQGNDAGARSKLAQVDASLKADEAIRAEACALVPTILEAVEQRRIRMGLGYFEDSSTLGSGEKGSVMTSFCQQSD